MGERTTLVLGSDGIAAAIAARLEARGDRVGRLPDDIDVTDAAAVAAALKESAPVDVVVLARIEPAAFVARPAVALDESEWDEACERTIRASFVLLQQAHAAVCDEGRVVVVLPTVAATGVVGLVPLCTAVESVRVMAKAVARRWGARGVTVNTIEVDLDAFVRGDGPVGGTEVPSVPVLGQPSLPERDAVTDVIGLIDLLSEPTAGGLTGALLVADRGTVLQP
jgi:NAD(P)-dependent dehydrogenase (short-subunit alcohol dehydrogenase family)